MANVPYSPGEAVAQFPTIAQVRPGIENIFGNTLKPLGPAEKLHLQLFSGGMLKRLRIAKRSHASQFKRSKGYQNIFDLPKRDDI